jgi:predicted alpha/beta-fold hydrolase
MIIFLPSYLIFNEIFLAGPIAFQRCVFSNNPSNYTIRKNNINSTLIERLYIPSENWRIIQYDSKDEEWVKLGGGKISSFYIHNNYSNPSIILVHGYRGCKHSQENMLIAGYLWRKGYNLLIPDLRNHGNSSFYEFQNPYVTFGSEEYKGIDCFYFL